MTIEDIKSTLATKMDQSIGAFKNNLTRIRTGRANPALLDTVQVDYYGSMVPLSRSPTWRCWTPAPSASSLGKRAWVPRLKRRFVKAIWA